MIFGHFSDYWAGPLARSGLVVSEHCVFQGIFRRYVWRFYRCLRLRFSHGLWSQRDSIQHGEPTQDWYSRFFTQNLYDTIGRAFDMVSSSSYPPTVTTYSNAIMADIPKSISPYAIPYAYCCCTLIFAFQVTSKIPERQTNSSLNILIRPLLNRRS